MNNESTVFIADDDAAALRSLKWLLESVGLRVAASQNPQQLLESYDAEAPGCVVLDVRMPGMSGLELQEQLVTRGCRHPVVFVTGHGDVPSCSRAFKAGAYEFLEKPVNEQRLLEVVQAAVDADRKRRSCAVEVTDMHERRHQLTPREDEVLQLLLDGKSIKQIAHDLDVTFPTAARHRARVLDKMGVENEAILVRHMLASDAP